MNALQEENAWEVTTTPVTLGEKIFTCTDRQAITTNFSYQVPATVTVKKRTRIRVRSPWQPKRRRKSAFEG